MFESKYSKLLTVLLIVIVVGIIGLLGFLGYSYYINYVDISDSEDYVKENFQTEISNSDSSNHNEENQNNDNSGSLEGLESAGITNNNTNTAKKLPTYKGFGVLGAIEIPDINLSYPVLEKVTRTSLETSVAFQYGVGLNKPGNNVIIGHNYRNGVFFSNNKKLEVGDTIYIIDNDKNKLTYKIYDMFYAEPSDASFYQRDTNGVPEITLSTCSDDSSSRLIIFARAE